MSDSIEELSRQYMENVWNNHGRSIGLFPIPEYPEFEAERGMWSTALDVLLTTLRYVAPATLLTLFWGQQSFLFKLLKYIDSAVRSLIFSSEEQKQTVLQWLGEAGPVRVDKLEVVWRHGWIVCGVLDAALPGACAGHPPTRLSLKHAQSIADNYLGVEPVFSRQELESNDTLSRHQEWKLMNYLESIRLALTKLTPPTPKPTNPPTQRASDEDVTQLTLDYIARGSGLVAAQLNHKVYFKIYPTAQQSMDPGEINILIHGPKDTYGVTVLPPILGKAQMIRQNLLGLQSKTCYIEKVLPITQGTTYLRSYGINDIKKTFYIPKTKYDIDIDVELKHDHARVAYIASLEGKYEISIASRGQNVVGSPFKVIVSNNILEHLERDSFCLEDGEEIDIVDVKTDRKVVLRIVDFVTEKMLLNENGTFEKISDEEARYLIQTENVNVLNKPVEDSTLKNKEGKSKSKSDKFYQIAKTVITLCRICKIFQNCCYVRKLIRNEKDNKDLRQQQDIPDILNSTIYDGHLKSHALLKNTNRIIVPENISVSLLTERPTTMDKENKLTETSDMSMHERIDCLENYNIMKLNSLEDDTLSIDTIQSNNPFVNDIYDQSCTVKKGLRPLIPKVFETHNSQNEETENITAELYIDNQFEMSNHNINPFIHTNEIDRPKTPVYKIISGEVTNRNDSVYIDSEPAFLTYESTCNSFTKPFLKHETETSDLEKPDFIIGAPVSLPPVNFASSSKTNIEIMKSEHKNKISNEKKIASSNCKEDFATKDSSVSTKEPMEDNFSSLDSNMTQDIIIIPRISPTPTTITQSQSSRETSPKKDTWDSAYVSIDDSNCLSENETFNKRKSPLSEELSKMGPAEREIWQNDSELNDVVFIDEDHKSYKHDFKRPEFTPIIEENERIINSDMKDGTYGNKTDNDSVAAAFSKLNDIYDDLYSNSENISVTTTQEDKLQNLGIDYTLQGNDIHVNSASELLADVKRHAKQFEGVISEVQATESCSVSPTLHVKGNADYQEQNNNDETQFGDRILYSNIVLEKKKYWDDKIRQIEAKSEEIRLFQNKRRLTAKHLRRNDSISKRRGKKIVQHLLKSGQDNYEVYTNSNTENTDVIKTQDCFENMKTLKPSEEKLAESSKYGLMTCFGKKAPKIKNESTLESKEVKETISKFANDSITDSGKKEFNSTVELKQELSEKVFQAFETSPKRFFGTCRKQILNKIDTFSGTPDVQKAPGIDMSCVNHESGLVSSRISMFHNISQTEELPHPQRKSKSMHNISQQSSERNTYLDRINRDSKEVVQEEKVSNEKIDCSNTITLSNRNQVRISYSPLKEKRARLIQSANNKSFDETLYPKHNNFDGENNYVKRTIKGFDKQSNSQFQSSTCNLKSISRSEMDIFNKTTASIKDEDLEKHKSYEELPKVSVKNFISLYEDVSKTSNNKTSSPVKNIHSIKHARSSNNQVPISTQGTTNKINTNETPVQQSSSSLSSTAKFEHPDISTKSKKTEDGSTNQIINSSLNLKDKEGEYLSLSDIDIEIIDNDREKKEASPKGETAHLDYKNRFSKAKQFFQSLEELREERKLRKFGLNSFQNSSSIESLDNNTRRKRSNIKKSHSMPSSEIAKAWNQLQEQKDEGKKLVKISEKFNVDDLFEDVMDGRLSRQGSFRGIPHKKAVLETFRSMENVSDCKLNSYEMAESQLYDFAKDNKIRNAQTYLSEYPYLPTTDPSKYHSRIDVNATGLITFKELKKIPRRNSVPNVRLNLTFTAAEL